MSAFIATLTNPMALYLVGMAAMLALAVVFTLSIRYYSKAKDIAPHLRKIEELAKRETELEVDIDESKKALKDLQQQIVDAELKIERGKQAEKWLKEKKEDIEETGRILAKVHEEIEKAGIQLTDLNRQVAERQQGLVDLERKVVEAEKAIEDLRKEHGELTAQVPNLRAEKANIERELGDAKAEKERLRKELAELTSKVAEAKGEVERLNGMIAAKKDELNKIEETVNKLSAEADTKRNEVAKLKGEEKVAREILAELTKRHGESSEKWKNLDAPIVNENSLRSPANTIDEKQWLADFGKSLGDNGFIFDDRAIRAFHTGLKCAQQTPLVVLAGISGTGKSLLPELYSAALGANFLSVPVQPRWDSPQDLFGFYNYMEGRYKATELARLLWQFDIYNNPAAEKWKDNGLPLNIVLLDEMNLARVEYYFSDLLSKLETRNGIDAKEPQQRRKAEIELECNAADKTETMRHLFVSPHTLFVGTMNEDESTQMLSDKVIDRSNVLRFGLPKTLADGRGAEGKEPNKSGLIADWKKQGRLTAEMWDRWCKPLDDKSKRDEGVIFLDRTVLPVLLALNQVNRAYGFRVDQAMRLYVLNYPGEYRDAVSDQIEMKILPKLNGLEIQDPNFGEVKRVIGDAIAAVRDEKLKEAFEASCNPNATFFKWRGVMR